MIAVRKRVPWILPSILGAAVVSGVLAAAPDPHEIYQVANERLRNGNLKAAGAGATRLRDLITRHPEWDPDGVFAQELLPSMEARLQRLQLAARKLEEFTQRALSDAKPPQVREDQDAVRAYGDWATSTIEHLRHERDGLIAAELPAPEDQVILIRTESYAKSQQLLETDVLRRMADAVDHQVEILMPADQRLQAVHTRLEQIKKGMMESVLERDRLRRQLADLQTKTTACQGALIGLAFEGADPGSTAGAPPPGDLGPSFSDRLDQELEAVRSEPSQSRMEYLTRRESLKRYRRYNSMLTGAGLMEDQSQRIKTLAEVVEKTPVQGRAWASASAPWWVYGSLMGLLSAATLALAWVTARRRRQLAARARRGPSPPSRVTGFPQNKDDTNAA